MTNRAEKIINDALSTLINKFTEIDKISQYNTEKVLNAFAKNNIGSRHFAPSNGYGYDDVGRDTLETLFSDIMHTESSIVRPQIASGTHALSLCLFGLLRYGDNCISATGAPYDTLQTVIGISGNEPVSLKNLGINYKQVELINDCEIDIDGVVNAIDENTKLIMIQRSKGYSSRSSILPSQMADFITTIKKLDKNIIVMVDNCYGEFVCVDEPSDYGADIIVGSLIKNLGAGLAPTGGYISGKQKYIDLIAAHLTAPGLGKELGSYEASYRLFYEGLFLAPHVVAQSLKIAMLFSEVFSNMGYRVFPDNTTDRSDIVQAIQFDDENMIIKFCQIIQSSSPIDSYAIPEPWDMPGYDNKIIMASGSFVSGSSIELSADAPIRKPYTVYFQGGLTLEHGIFALKNLLIQLIK